MNYLYNLSKTALLIVAATVAFLSSTTSSEAQSWVAQNQQDGFILKKVVSDTMIATGQPFSYTVYFTIPAGATNVTITDAIPSSLVFLGHSFTSACGTPIVTAPAINSLGGTYSLSWASFSSGGCSGSFTVTVAFPNGTTCPGTTARNRVCITAKTVSGTAIDLCTPFVSTSASATNPWKINKYPVGAAWQGGTCPYASGSDTITWQICVYKDPGVTGQLNLVGGIVKDTLPAGAVLVSSNCGATQSGNIITWNVGALSALSMYNTVCCQIKVYYPAASFPSGSSITNNATLSGQLGTANQPCSSFSVQSNTPCVKLVSLTSGSIGKWVYTNRQPGCGGKYLIYICNTGTSTISFTAKDTLPTQLTGFAISSAWNVTATLTAGIVTITGTLTAGQCGYVYVDFVIPSTATVGSTVTNCVSMTIIGVAPQQACVSFVIDAPAPSPCLWKEVCNKQPSYTPGSVFRYRLRIQNIGGLPITGSTLTDVLDPNLQYVGNPSSYTDNAWNAPCTTTPANPWPVTLTYNSITNTVTALLDTIPATCQNIFYAACGMYGTAGVPYYFIEFDVKVRDTSALGNVPNAFKLSGGSLGTGVYNSNVENVLVTGVVGYNLQKGVKKPADPNYTSATSTTAGSTVDYRLKMNSSGTAALRHVVFADLLPRDNGTADSKILSPCGPRGSVFDVSYNSFTSSSPSITQWNNPATTLANVNNLSPTGIPGPAFTIGCPGTGAWSSAWSAGMKNIAAYFGTTAIGTGGATVDFSGKVSTLAKPNENACNTFAASGWTKHLIQSSLPTFQLAGQLESDTACVRVDSADKPCLEQAKVEVKCGEVNANGSQQYVFTISAVTCSSATMILSSPDGVFSPATFTMTTASWSINTTFTHTNTNNPIKINYTIICNGKICRDSIFRDLPECPIQEPVDTCCLNFRRDIGQPTLYYDNSGVVSLSTPMTAGPVPIKRFTATIVSAQLRKVCFSSPGPWTRIFGDITAGNLVVPPAPGPQLLSVFSREAVWGPGECINWTKGAQLKLKMIFPAFSGSFICKDTLRFTIRYSFTDCECRTCDTLVTYTIVRTKKWLPWDPIDIGIGIIRTQGKMTPAGGDEVQSSPPNATSLEMTDLNTGDFWVISPDNAANDVVVTGVEIQSSAVPLTSLKNGTESGIVQDDIGFITTDIKPGDNVPISLTFDNNQSLMQFKVMVRMAYTVSGFEETFYTDPIEFTARVPGAAQDVLDISTDPKPDNVKSYALYFNCSNGYKQSITAIGLKRWYANSRILAVGPPSAALDQITYLMPRKLDDGSWIVTVPAQGVAGVEPDSIVKPIYITVLGAGDNTMIEYSTYDENAAVVSEGTLTLSNPISGVMPADDYGSGILVQSVIPNPAETSVTVTLSFDRPVSNAQLSITDVRGISVLTVPNSTIFEMGTYVNIIDISSLPSGTYFITLKTVYGVTSKPLTIIR
jgi:uncharacterized repeat protein (TIGR01451 family)